jgi:hypothetical protein
MNKKLAFYLYLLVLVTFSCNKNSKIESENTIDSKSDIKKTELGMMESIKINNDSIEIPSFEIDLSLSHKAEEKLANDEETVVVTASFFGEAKSDPNQEGPITLTYSKIELTKNRKAIFKNIKFSKALYDSLLNKNIWVIVDVTSGRKSINENFLDTDILE